MTHSIHKVGDWMKKHDFVVAYIAIILTLILIVQVVDATKRY